MCCVNVVCASIPGFYLFNGKSQLKNYIKNQHWLIFDSHGIHIALQNIEVTNTMGIDFLIFPTHTTQGLHPLDVSMFVPSKYFSKSERSVWMEKKPKVEVKRFELSYVPVTHLKWISLPQI